MTTALRVEDGRLLPRLEALAELGATEGGGCCRLALTDGDKSRRDVVVCCMWDLGLDVRIDAIGNAVAPWGDPERAPATMASPIDTVPTGAHGRNLGVPGGAELAS